MARKKIIFVIVEGPSDETAMGAVLSKLFDDRLVYLHVTRCDITTEPRVDTSNIVSTIGDLVKSYAKKYHFTKTHFQEIIHITDTDGAYIPDGNVKDDASCQNTLYSLKWIRTANREGILRRNAQKRQNLDKLCRQHEIWGLPYRIYFMSCNLDHVLYDKQNSTDEEKESDSYTFAKRYKEMPEEFVKYISGSEFSVMDGYKESWAFIGQGLRSLERHTNFGLCFQGSFKATGLTAPEHPAR